MAEFGDTVGGVTKDMGVRGLWKWRVAIASTLALVALVLASKAAGATTDPAELTEPTVVIDPTREHSDGLIMVCSVAHEQNGDPTLNPAGGIATSFAAGDDSAGCR